ncbi:hypothetical protein [Nocardioides koreensis]|uniref:hypothetical protein n=1 Tax=Nocardioides koreensis TaxID=433651 RepID=UPI0031E15F5B
MSPQSTATPAPLVVAASLVAIEGLLMIVLAVLELASLSSERVSLGLTTAGFFVVYGVGLALCAWALSRCRSWARSPVVLAQLIWLGMAWSLRGGDGPWASVALAVVAVVVLAGVLHPASIDALSDRPSEEG